jgi:hypothetical protein
MHFCGLRRCDGPLALLAIVLFPVPTKDTLASLFVFLYSVPPVQIAPPLDCLYPVGLSSPFSEEPYPLSLLLWEDRNHTHLCLLSIWCPR